MVGWIQQEATARRIRLGPAAAQELAKRIGAFVAEGDVDRRRQSYPRDRRAREAGPLPLGETVTADDVRALVPEAMPGIDLGVPRRGRRAPVADGDRAARPAPADDAAPGARGRPPPPHPRPDRGRRPVREGAPPPALMKALNSKSEYAIDKLIKQARGWSPEELDAALEGVLELDAATKGPDERAMSEGQLRLTFLLWLTDRVRQAANRGERA